MRRGVEVRVVRQAVGGLCCYVALEEEMNGVVQAGSSYEQRKMSHCYMMML